MASRGGLSIVQLARLFRLSLPFGGAWSPYRLRRVAVLSVVMPLFLLLQLLHWAGLLLDELLFPEYRQTVIREPLFIVGLPRSGTSSLQRTLAADPRFTTMRLWELVLAPSIIERKLWLAVGRLDRALGSPLRWLGARLQRRLLSWMNVIHPISPREPEEDYLLLLPVFGCFLLVLALPSHPGVWSLVSLDDWPEADRRPIVDFYRACLQRHLYLAGANKTLLSKNPSFTAFVRSLDSEFSDARFICCVRDPVEVVPSQLSSVREALEFFGAEVSEPGLRERFVSMLERYGRHVMSLAEEFPDDRWVVVSLSQMRSDLLSTIEGMYRRFGWPLDDSVRETLLDRSRMARDHVSSHAYGLEEFGLTRTDLRVRFAAFNRQFGFEESNMAAGTGPPPEADGSTS
jgi:hypothetical protein